MSPADHPPPDHLSTEQAARVLGVKPETVYAYVSRGLLPRVTVPGRRGSWFPAAVVESMRDAGPRNRVTGLSERIRTRITLVQADRLYYRGRDVVELARRSPFEDVCALLWECDPAPFDAVTQPALESVVAQMPRRVDRIRTALCVLAGHDSVHGDLEPAAVVRAARRAISAAVDSLPRLGPETPGDPTVAGNLLVRLSSLPATPERIAVLDAAMVLLADHELASSTTAARVAAATRADLSGVLLAALGAMDSPLHGAAASRAGRMLSAALADPAGTISEYVAGDRSPPGFGHLVYVESDPRADHLIERVAHLPGVDRHLLSVAEELITQWEMRRGWFPNTDFALALLGAALEMVPDAGEVIFTVSRLAGWTAHALEEYAAEPLRFRLRGLYVGEQPAGPSPTTVGP